MQKDFTPPLPPQDNTPMILTTYNELRRELNNMPSKLLESITSSVNVQKGKLAELVAYLNLRSEYDQVFPMGGVVDYIALKYPSQGSEGQLDFIDVKNGMSARLSKPQTALKKVIQKGKINFIQLRTDTELNIPIQDGKNIDPGSGTGE